MHADICFNPKGGALRVARRGHAATPGSISDDAMMQEIAAVMMQLVGVVFACVGWFINEYEAAAAMPLPFNLVAFLAAIFGVSCWVLPLSGFFLALPVCLLAAWRAKNTPQALLDTKRD